MNNEDRRLYFHGKSLYGTIGLILISCGFYGVIGFAIGRSIAQMFVERGGWWEGFLIGNFCGASFGWIFWVAYWIWEGERSYIFHAENSVYPRRVKR
jgi:hypothetical protein